MIKYSDLTDKEKDELELNLNFNFGDHPDAEEFRKNIYRDDYCAECWMSQCSCSHED